MSKPIKKISLGKCTAAIWKKEKEYDGKPTYSVSFQKSYKDKKDDSWKNTEYFSMVDLRDLYLLVGNIASTQVKEINFETKEKTATDIVKDVFEDAQVIDEDSNVPF